MGETIPPLLSSYFLRPFSTINSIIPVSFTCPSFQLALLLFPFYAAFLFNNLLGALFTGLGRLDLTVVATLLGKPWHAIRGLERFGISLRLFKHSSSSHKTCCSPASRGLSDSISPSSSLSLILPGSLKTILIGSRLL